MHALALTLCTLVMACQQTDAPEAVAAPTPEAPTPDAPAVAAAVEVAITYCIPWGYEKRAASLADKIREARPEANVQLHGESDKLGMFIVVANSAELWNKYETGNFPEPEAIIAQLPKAPTS